LLAFAACSQPEDAPEPRRVILVTLDTVRADHLSCYGYPLKTSPFLDRLAAEGVLFEHAFSSSSQTGPAHASLLTSLHPAQHGVEANSMLPDPVVPLMAEMFRDLGFETGGFVSVRFLDSLKTGFRTFDNRLYEKDSLYRSGPETIDAALEWIEQRGPDDKWFLWLHLFDVHEWLRRPYMDAEALAEIGAAVEPWDEHAAFLAEHHGTHAATFPVRHPFQEAVVDYDARIRSVDRELERLFERVAEHAGDPAETMWVVTSDHGEGLGSHEYLFHGQYVYDEQLHVPLIFHWPEGTGERRIESLVRLIDVLPTFGELFGFLQGTPPFQGTSLAGTLRGGPVPPIEAAFAQRGEDALKLKKGWEKGPIYALRTRGAKYIHHEHGDDELYDLEADPLETTNLADEERENALGVRAVEIYRHSKGEAPLRRRDDEQTNRDLKGLGYTD
jgi:arylsulfatase A-like enzyme